jgi:hypothetical protein
MASLLELLKLAVVVSKEWNRKIREAFFLAQWSPLCPISRGVGILCERNVECEGFRIKILEKNSLV